jgi:hypothetical protein
MDILGGLKAVLGGGDLFSNIVDTVKEYIPSEQAKLEMQLKVQTLAYDHELKVLEATNEAEKTFNEKIAQYEGTAADLKAVPVIGPVMLFARGSVRPCFCFYTLYMDYMVMSGLWDLDMGTVRGNVFVIMNTLVLGFHFGERALQNIMPLITNMVVAKQEAKNNA